jgi:hypothetical protein
MAEIQSVGVVSTERRISACTACINTITTVNDGGDRIRAEKVERTNSEGQDFNVSEALYTVG